MILDPPKEEMLRLSRNDDFDTFLIWIESRRDHFLQASVVKTLSEDGTLAATIYAARWQELSDIITECRNTLA